MAAGALVGLPQVNDFAARSDQQEGELNVLRGEVDRLTQQHQELQAGITFYRNELEKQSMRLDNQNSVIQNGFGRMEDGFVRMENGLGSLDGLRTTVEEQVVSAASVQPDVLRETLRREVLRPVFQISGEDAVGSAVLVYHGSDEKGPYYLALSCFHVVRDIIHYQDVEAPHEVLFDNIFDQLGGDPVTLQGRMVAENIPADLALLRIDTERELGPIASIAALPKESLVDAFTPVYTVGCPLGTSAQATHGQVTRNDWVVDGQDYWMVSSPAYFGNSGGGVFLEEGHELVGIFSKIYTHGTYRPQVVTHMGLAVPLSTIYEWVKAIGYDRILPQAETVSPRIEEASSAPQVD
ncbi:MAG: hypothetical protein GY747_05510 [Planctomycetes bacterium]|nr:hypothetical protein [Planctomycetota bacterium]MCP4770392.1 hypothetical protein [Planctomycetota bacterium]MCP4860516.1 hypothetical protein [Planctomycetota bacterium]